MSPLDLVRRRPTPVGETATSDALTVAAFRGRGSSTVLIAGNVEVSYAELADLVEHRRIELGKHRRLVVLSGCNDLDMVVTWIAALESHHPIALVDGARSEATLRATFAPDQLTDDDLHPDLAVLMSTSGSTGSSKFVRLSRRAVLGNALAIADSLHLSSGDRGITSLPLHYCYGLSVLTSHLSVGASVVLTDASVVDPCFWNAMRHWGVTGLAGVPHTFHMIDRLGGDVLTLPRLRYVTQAGGPMHPDDVVRYATLGRQTGWDFVVMYGQTEATARMAYLPSDDVFDHPGAVGRAIPGSTIRVDAAPGEAGEIVFSGPSVMMGYATTSADLASGSTLSELRTGDIGRVNEAGYVEIIGRAHRFIKVHGKRIDLGQIEASLRIDGRHATCAGDDDGLVVVIESDVDGLDADLRSATAKVVDLPEQHIVAVRLTQIPRTSSNKVDGPAVTASARLLVSASMVDDRGVADVWSTFELIFGPGRVEPTSTFSSLGGDSFSYVETSMRLERVLGDVPTDWHLTPVRELAALTSTQRAGIARLETSVVIRAIGIALIVCTHMRLYRLPGGAHTLLALVGYNFARFQLTATEVPNRLRRAAATITRVAAPTSLWIGVNMLFVGGYSVGALFLVNNYFGSPWRRDGRWQYWYFETFVQVMVVLAIVFSIGAVRRLERKGPFLFALGVLGLTMLFRFDVIVWGDSYNAMFRPHAVASFVALGWCAQRVRNVPQRLVVTALLVITTWGYFGQTDRELRIIALVAALIWVPRIAMPSPVAKVVGLVAAASMYIFLVHWQVWPLFTSWLDRHVAFVATMAVGVGVWWVVERATDRVAARRRPFLLTPTRRRARRAVGVRGNADRPADL